MSRQASTGYRQYTFNSLAKYPTPTCLLRHHRVRLTACRGSDLPFHQCPLVAVNRASPMVVRLSCHRRQQANDQVGTRRNGERSPNDKIAQCVAVRHGVESHDITLVLQ